MPAGPSPARISIAQVRLSRLLTAGISRYWVARYQKLLVLRLVEQAAVLGGDPDPLRRLAARLRHQESLGYDVWATAYLTGAREGVELPPEVPPATDDNGWEPADADDPAAIIHAAVRVLAADLLRLDAALEEAGATAGRARRASAARRDHVTPAALPGNADGQPSGIRSSPGLSSTRTAASSRHSSRIAKPEPVAVDLESVRPTARARPRPAGRSHRRRRTRESHRPLRQRAAKLVHPPRPRGDRDPWHRLTEQGRQQQGQAADVRSGRLLDVIRERPLVDRGPRRPREPERSKSSGGTATQSAREPDRALKPASTTMRPGTESAAASMVASLEPEPGRAPRGQPGLLVPGPRRAAAHDRRGVRRAAAPGAGYRARGLRRVPHRRWCVADTRCRRWRRRRSGRSRGPSDRARLAAARS